MIRRRAIRETFALPDESLLVRALFDLDGKRGDYDRATLILDATFNFDEFGYYGLSLWLVGEQWPLDRLMTEKTGRASRVALYTAVGLRRTGLTLVPSGRAPHYDATDGALLVGDSGGVRVTAGSAVEVVDRFLAAPYTVEENDRHLR